MGREVALEEMAPDGFPLAPFLEVGGLPVGDSVVWGEVLAVGLEVDLGAPGLETSPAAGAGASVVDDAASGGDTDFIIASAPEVMIFLCD